MAAAKKPVGLRKAPKPPKPRTAVKPATLRLLRKVRKPLAPPTRVEDDPRAYSRARERKRMRRERDDDSIPATGDN